MITAVRLPSRNRRRNQQMAALVPHSSLGTPQALARQAKTPAHVRELFDRDLEQKMPSAEPPAWWKVPWLSLTDTALGLWDILSELL